MFHVEHRHFFVCELGVILDEFVFLNCRMSSLPAFFFVGLFFPSC